jgi:hypothetical protein
MYKCLKDWVYDDGSGVVERYKATNTYALSNVPKEMISDWIKRGIFQRV